MTKHTAKCIDYFERLEKSYREQAEEYHAKYEEAGPGSFWLDEYMRAKAQADAYKTCAEALKDKKFFERPIIEHAEELGLSDLLSARATLYN